MGGGLIAPATSTTQNFTKKIEKKFFCINVSKNTKEKLSSGFRVTKIKTDITRACFPNSWCNQPPYKDRVKMTDGQMNSHF